MKLGRIKPPAARKALAPRLAPYLTRALPPAPPAVDNTDGAYYAMYGNDHYGDCTCAALANYFSVCAAREGQSLSFAERDVVDFYLSLTGGRDNGLVEMDVLDAARAGFPLSREKRVAAWVSVNPRNHELVRSCCALFWCLYVGAELPLTAQGQTLWDVVGPDGAGAPGSWGGHAVVVPAYDSLGPTCLTWGKQQRMTWNWWDAYVDECHVLLDADRARLHGVDFDALMTDLQVAAAVQGG